MTGKWTDLTMFCRSAPENPGVPRASTIRLTSSIPVNQYRCLDSEEESIRITWLSDYALHVML